MSIVASVLLLTGGFLALVAAIGLHRFSDLFARMHAATKPQTLGLALTLLGAILLIPDAGARSKLALVIMLQLLTAPIGAHLVGRAAFRTPRGEADSERDPIG